MLVFLGLEALISVVSGNLDGEVRCRRLSGGAFGKCRNARLLKHDTNVFLLKLI